MQAQYTTSIKFAAKLQQKGKPRPKKNTASKQQLSTVLCGKFFNRIKYLIEDHPMVILVKFQFNAIK